MRGGDLNPERLVDFRRIFSVPSAKNRHLPPPSLAAGHTPFTERPGPAAVTGAKYLVKRCRSERP